MHSRLVLPALLVVILSACGGTKSTVFGTISPPSPTPAGNGGVDCTAINTAARQLLKVQFLAQLTTADTIEQVKTKQVGDLDLDVFLGAMHDLHALDSYASPLGDPKAAIDFYETAAKAAQVLFATDPMTQAAIDTYNQNVGTVAGFLGHQIAISGAIDAAGC